MKQIKYQEETGQVGPAGAPEVNYFYGKYKKQLLNELQTYKIIQALTEYIANHLLVTLFTKSPLLGATITLHSRYIHTTHNLHIDIPSAKEDGTVQLDELGPQLGPNYLALTFVLYIMDSSTLAPEGQGTTVIASKDHQDISFDKIGTQVSSCPFTNCLISVFPGDNYHAIAPNPGLIRATLAYKVILKPTKYNYKPTWDQVVLAIDDWVKINGNTIEEPKQLIYNDIIEAVKNEHLSFLPENNPYIF